jgi:hypothetical protein
VKTPDWPLGVPVSAPTEEDEGEWEVWEEAENRRYEECGQRICDCHADVARKLGDDEAWQLFAEFLMHRPKSKRGRPSKHSHPERDALLLEAHREAPMRQKRASVIAAGREYKMSAEAAWRQLRRLRKEELAKKAAAEAMAQLFKEWANSRRRIGDE